MTVQDSIIIAIARVQALLLTVCADAVATLAQCALRARHGAMHDQLGMDAVSGVIPAVWVKDP